MFSHSGKKKLNEIIFSKLHTHTPSLPFPLLRAIAVLLVVFRIFLIYFDLMVGISDVTNSNCTLSYFRDIFIFGCVKIRQNYKISFLAKIQILRYFGENNFRYTVWHGKPQNTVQGKSNTGFPACTVRKLNGLTNYLHSSMWRNFRLFPSTVYSIWLNFKSQKLWNSLISQLQRNPPTLF